MDAGLCSALSSFWAMQTGARSLARYHSQSHSSVSAARAPQDGPQLGGNQGAQPNLGYPNHLTTLDLGVAKDIT